MTDKEESWQLQLIEPTKVQKRLLNASDNISNKCTKRGGIDFLHSVFTQLGLPRSKTDQLVFERTNGNSSLRLEAGPLMGATGWEQQCLPYGAKARLCLIYVNSQAVLTQNPEIEVGRSLTAFLQTLGFANNGRNINELKKQIKALAACRCEVAFTGENRRTTFKAQPFDKFEEWVSTNKDQTAMWPGIIQLSSNYFNSILEHSIPLDRRAIAALSNSALALDIYTFLAQRLHRIPYNDVLFLNWHNLKNQFGQEYKDPKNFKKAFFIAMRSASTVYPQAKIELVRGGYKFSNSPPPVMKLLVGVNK